MKTDNPVLKKILRFAPPYAVFPSLLCLAVNLLAYNGNRIFTDGWKHYDLSIGLDAAIPFLRWTILLYVLFFAFLPIGYLGVAQEGKKVFYRMAVAGIAAKLICLVFFFVLPTYMPDWPSGTFEIKNFTDWLLQFIYDHDEPNNLFPSIHVLESWLVMRTALAGKKLPKPFKIGISVAAICIILSTLTVKQHLLADVAGGILVTELSMLLTAKLRGERVLEWLESKFTRKETSAV